MNKKEPARDERRSFRCPVADAHQSCQLKVGSQELPVTLQDESAGGFSVLVDRPLHLKINDTAELQTSAGRFEVSVIHVMRVPPPEGLPPAELARRGPWFRMGLRRLEEIGLPQPPRVSLFAHGLQLRQGQWCSSNGVFVAVCLVLTIAVVTVPLVLMGTNWYAANNGNNRFVKPLLSGDPLRVHRGSREGDSRSVANENDLAADFQQALKSAVGQISDLALLAKPYAIRELQLTGGQQYQLRQLIDATSQAVRDLDAQLRGQKRQEVSELRTKVIDEANRTALELLTDQQRAQWEQMTAKP